MKYLIKIFRPVISKLPLLADYYRQLRDRKALRQTPVYRDGLGFRFNGPALMERGEFEPQESRLIEHLLDHVDTLVNVGANAGYYCLKALARDKTVYAFEPNALNAAILLRNVQANQFEDRFHFFPLAAGSGPGILPLYGGSTGASLIRGWAGQTRSTLVPVNSIDNTIGPALGGQSCLVLIDIEGAELDCLRGSSSLINQREHCIFLVEITALEHQPAGTVINPNMLETFRLFFNRGYRAYMANTLLEELHEEDVIRAVEDRRDLPTHNFLFLSSARSLAELSLRPA